MELVSGDELLRLPVRVNGIELGRTIDLVLDLGGLRTLGLEVLCGDRVSRFLPLAAAHFREGEIALESPFTLVEDADLAFYRGRADTLSDLRGAAVDRAGAAVGELRDVVLDGGGTIVEVVVSADGREASIRAEELLVRSQARRRPA